MSKEKAKFERFYYLPVCQKPIHPESFFDESLGNIQEVDRPMEAVKRALNRAKSGEYSTIVLPANSILREDFSDIVSSIKNCGFDLVMEINSLGMHLHWDLVEQKIKPLDCQINILLEGFKLRDQELIESIEAWGKPTYFTLMGREGVDFYDVLKRLGDKRLEKLYWYFPYTFEYEDHFYSVEEIFKLLRKIKKDFPQLQIRPPRGIDIFDPRVDPEMELESMVEVFYETSCGSSEKEISVVIPSYNNRDYLVNTVRHLFNQDLPKENYEVVVVDDGSDDGTQEALIQFAENFKGQVNFKYIFYPRFKPRKMGDSQYRAGVSRNLGVKHTSGKILSFLDSDILTPKNFLSHLIERHKSYDLVQCRRPHLKKQVSSLDTNYEDIVIGRDTFVPEGGYWEKFYEMADNKDWNELDNCWKYVCTHTLSLPRQLFLDVGWFRKNYIFYGFEDTDLGLRIYKGGCLLNLSECEVYHLFHKNERSEFQNSSFNRHLLLQKTAKVFFHNWLDPDIYLLFEGMLRDEMSIKKMIYKIKGLFGNGKKRNAKSF